MPLKITAVVAGLVVTGALFALGMVYRCPERSPDPIPPSGPRLGILAIGDSIMEGYPLHSPDHAVDRMAEALRGLDYEVSLCKQGVGLTSAADWAADKDGVTTKALAEAEVYGLQPGDFAWIMLGTNDAQYAHRIEDFEADLRTLCGRLKEAGYRPVVNVCPWQKPGPLPSSKHQGESRLSLLREVNRRILVVAESGAAELGDDTAYEHFRENPDHLHDGLHPNRSGSAHLGRAWARAASRLVK